MSSASMQLLIEAIDKASGPLKSVMGAVEGVQKSAAAMGKKLTSVGTKMSAGLTLPIVGAGVAAVKASGDFSGLMANVAALGVGTDRVGELKTGIQELAVESGTSTSILGEGMYTLISAYGEGAETMEQLAANTKLARGGLASVTEAIELTSAVTKGYGDTSLKAQKQVSDMALETVRLGQTTLPELAGALPRVTSLSANLGVTQAEMFAVMATGTGVLGNAGEVATQTKAALSALMAPSKGLTGLFEDMGVKSGKALIEQKGFAGALQAITAAADKADVPLQDFLGSVEAQSLAIGLSGELSEEYARKLGLIGNSAGATDKAVAAQTTGIGAMNLALGQLKAQAEVTAQTFGDMLAPTVTRLATALVPAISNMSAFATANPGITRIAAGFLAVVAAIGPLLIGLGMVTTAVSTMIAAFSAGGALAFIGPLIAGIASGFAAFGTVVMAVVSAVVTGLAGLAAAITLPGLAIAALVAGLVAAAVAIVMHWSQVKAFFATLGAAIGSALMSASQWFSTLDAKAAAVASNVISSMSNMASGVASSAMAAGQGLVSGFMSAVGGVASAMASIVSTVISALSGLAGQALAAGARIVSSIAAGISAGVGAVGAAMSSVGAAIAAKLPGSPVKEGPLVHTLNGTKNAGYQIASMLAAGMNAGQGLLDSASTRSVAPVASDAAGRASSSGGSFQPVVNITVNGDAPGVASEIDKQLERTFARLYAQYQAQQNRVYYG